MDGELLGGRYRLLRPVGEGGMGQVWEARDERLGRAVAVKVISLLAGGGSRGDEARARFLREARITARLQHPNIVTIHDLGETGTDEGEAPFLVMELVRGEGLDAKLRRGPVGPADAARWGAQISDALAEAHAAGVLHRDIKPSNVLVTPSGMVKVLDFGVARAADPYATRDRITQTGFIVGTPAYMAPEQARGVPEPRSDLYALGCVLFELLTGRLPFQAPDSVSYLSAHLTEAPPAPGSVAAAVPPAWDDLVLTLLDKDPAERFEDAAALSRALRELERAPAVGRTRRLTQRIPVAGSEEPTLPRAGRREAEPSSRSRSSWSWKGIGGRLVLCLFLACVACFAYPILFLVIGGDPKDARAGDCLWFDGQADRARYGYTYEDVSQTEPCRLPFRMYGNSHYEVVRRLDGTDDPARCAAVPGAVVNADTAVLRSSKPPSWVLCVKPV
ncbi:serine/threonine-protein kinase [Streptomyces sp. NPDC059708]|uniref:serine/threonine-protein kinase n=2 Tax=unclassified Streptomyces TaxID=2593676 RepID=UPI0036C41BED